MTKMSHQKKQVQAKLTRRFRVGEKARLSASAVFLKSATFRKYQLVQLAVQCIKTFVTAAW